MVALPRDRNGRPTLAEVETAHVSDGNLDSPIVAIVSGVRAEVSVRRELDPVCRRIRSGVAA